MSTPYIGEIRMFAGNFAPAGWAVCDGSLVPIAENDTLFTLIGTTYGGDGQETFALPDLRGRVPVHQGAGAGLSNRIMGEMGGAESVTLTVPQIPAHTHAASASTAGGTSANPAGRVLASSPAVTAFLPGAPSAPLAAASVGSAGGSQPHDNQLPFLSINFIISLFGVFPSQT